MVHAIHRVTAFSIVGPYTISVAFSDGTEQRIYFEPVLHGVLFGPLRDLATFNQVTLDPEAATLVWPNGADFDPATLHDWPEVIYFFSPLINTMSRVCVARATASRVPSRDRGDALRQRHHIRRRAVGQIAENVHGRS